jgi:hypothetical protein
MTNLEIDFRKTVKTGAWLYRYGHLDLQTAIDKLQGYAVRRGVVRALGQDNVQQVLSSAFADIEREAA